MHDKPTPHSTPTLFDYERDAQGNVLERVYTIPYRPELLVLFHADGNEPSAVEWGGPGLEHKPKGPDFAEDEPWPTGELREGAEWPPDFRANMWCLDERVCQRYGFTLLDVARVELPTLDYASAAPLQMRVVVRVRV